MLAAGGLCACMLPLLYLMLGSVCDKGWCHDEACDCLTHLCRFPILGDALSSASDYFQVRSRFQSRPEERRKLFSEFGGQNAVYARNRLQKWQTGIRGCVQETARLRWDTGYRQYGVANRC